MLKLKEDTGLEDFLEVKESYTGADTLSIEVYEPWAGDTETGFGRGGTIQLNKEQVELLAGTLITWLSGVKDA